MSFDHSLKRRSVEERDNREVIYPTSSSALAGKKLKQRIVPHYSPSKPDVKLVSLYEKQSN